MSKKLLSTISLATSGFLFVIFILLIMPAYATTEYARQTGLNCNECHIEAIGGGHLTAKGQQFLSDMKAKGLYRPLTKIQRIVRFIIGYVHLLTAIAWFGTILYVHILLKPAYAARGLPKGELFLGWLSMIVLTVTGTLLTIAKIPTLRALYTTRFGILLSIKIFLFLIMASSALIVTFYIGPKLKRKWKVKWEDEISKGKQDLTIEELHSFDGRDGRPAYIAFKGMIHDVSKSRFWNNGSHLKKHLAGHDLTEAIKTAPHGDDKLLLMPVVGKLIEPGEKVTMPFHERLFYAFAYMNLVLVFLITLIIALWRWS